MVKSAFKPLNLLANAPYKSIDVLFFGKIKMFSVNSVYFIFL